MQLSQLQVGFICVLMGAAVAYVFWVYPLYALRDARLLQLRGQTTLGPSTRIITPGRQDLLTDYYSNFAEDAQVQEVLAKLHDAAPRRNLYLPGGGYRLTREIMKSKIAFSDGHTLIKKYEIVLLIKGNYENIRGYISDVMMTLPGLALHAMSFISERNDIGAELRFILYVREGD